jgi:hypothetical protein
MSSELLITSSAFYRNSLFIERKMSGMVAVASGRYYTRYGTVELYGENYGQESTRKPHFTFDFTHEGRNYRCFFEEWLSDATIRLRAIRFVEQCRALTPEPVPTQWAYEQACAALEKHRQRADAAEALLTQAAEAMAGSYDVTDYPANGTTDLDTAIRAIQEHLAAKEPR